MTSYPILRYMYIYMYMYMLSKHDYIYITLETSEISRDDIIMFYKQEFPLSHTQAATSIAHTL